MSDDVLNGKIDQLPVSPDPMVILDRLTAQAVDPDKLGRVIDLVRDWKKDRAREAFASAMNLCQQEMPIILEDSENKHTKSTYASLEAVNRVCKPCYTRHGFSIQFSEGDGKIAEEVRIIADVMHYGGFERRYYIDLPRDGTGAKGGQTAMNPLQGKGSTFSYGQRYLVKMIFNLTIAGEDVDGQGLDPTLTEDEVLIMNTLFDECRGAGREVNKEKFKAWIASFQPAIENIGDVRRSNFIKVKKELERQRDAKRAT